MKEGSREILEQHPVPKGVVREPNMGERHAVLSALGIRAPYVSFRQKIAPVHKCFLVWIMH